jgi:hypothetical protein
VIHNAGTAPELELAILLLWSHGVTAAYEWMD